MNERKSTKTRSPLHSLAAARPLTGLRLRDLVGPVAVGSATLMASLTLTVVSAWLITRAWQMPPVMDLTVAVTAVRALGISRAVFRYCDRLVSHRLALRCAGTARVQAYRLLASAPATQAATLTRGQVLTSLTTDIEAVADVIVRSVIPALVFVVTGIAAVGIAAALSVPAAGVLLVGLLIAGVLAPWAVGSSVRTADRRRANSTGRYVAAIDRVLTDSPALRVREELDQALNDAEDAAHDLTSATESGAPARATGAGLGVFASAAAVLGVLVVAVLAYGDGTHSPQWLGVLVLLATASFEAASALPEAAEAATRASGAADRLTALVGGTGNSGSTGDLGDTGDAKPTSSPTPIDLRPDLRAEKLRYGRDQELGCLDLALTFGDRHTLVAASGTGKTTLLMTMAGLLPALEGRVTLDGQDITDLTPKDLHRIVAYLPEDAHIFATTVRDNLAVGAPEAPDDLMLSTLEAMGLGDWVSGLPDGLDTLLNSGADSLSGGQRRRLLLTRMLLTDAPVLLLDEPFEHMDAAGSEHLEEVLLATSLPGRRPHRTIVVVRHPRPRI